MNLNDDVIKIIKEYAGITSLDIVNSFYALRPYLKQSNICGYNEINMKVIWGLIKLIPYLYTSCKKTISGTHEKHYLEFFIDGYCARTDAIVALSLFFPVKNGNVYAKQVSDVKLARFCKKTLNLHMQTFRIHYDEIHMLMKQIVLYKKQGCDKCNKCVNVHVNFSTRKFLCEQCYYRCWKSSTNFM